MDDKDLGRKEGPIAVGLYGLLEQLELKVPLPVVRSEVIPGARKTTLSDNKILEQYPKSYLPTGLMGNLRFAMRYEPIDLGVLNAAFSALDIRELEECDLAILARAIHYLFTKETKSSFAIEGEVPSRDRTARFVAALESASGFDAGSKEAFVRLQNSIVDARYAQQDWRTTQNYVSQTLPDYSEDVHFVCPKPEDVPPLMDSWMGMEGRLAKTDKMDPN